MSYLKIHVLACNKLFAKHTAEIVRAPTHFNALLFKDATGGMPEGHQNTHLSRLKEYTLSLKQGKIFPHNMISLAQVVWTFDPLVGKYSEPTAHPFVAKQRSKDCERDCSSQVWNNFISCCQLAEIQSRQKYIPYCDFSVILTDEWINKFW